MKEHRFNGHHGVIRPDGSTSQGWQAYRCGYCGRDTAGAVVAYWHPAGGFHVFWLACTACGNPSVLDPEGIIRPGSKAGPALEGLPAEIAAAYEEARTCLGASANIACELVCRKILMHVAVEKGAKEGEPFASYITHLEQAGYVTPPMKPWVEQIRKIGNAATHKLETPDRTRAESALMFTAELLRLVYEMEYLTRRYVPQSKP